MVVVGINTIPDCMNRDFGSLNCHRGANSVSHRPSCCGDSVCFLVILVQLSIQRPSFL